MGLGRRFWKLWTATATSDLADGIVLVAFPLAAITMTRSPALVAGTTVALRVPWLLASLHAGVLADRCDRRVVMLANQFLRGASLLVLAAFLNAGSQSIWALYAAAVLVGASEVSFTMAARPMIPMVVRREQLTKANGRIHAAETLLNEFVGPPVAGFLVQMSIAIAIAASASGYLIAALAVLLLPGSYRPGSPSSRSIRHDIGEGIQFLWQSDILRTLTIMVAVMAAGHAAWMALLVLHATGPMGLSTTGYGMLLSVIAVGAFIGSVVAEVVERSIGRLAVLFLNVVATGVMFGAPALSTNAWLVAVASFAGGATGVMWSVVTSTIAQEIVPERLLGRVGSASRLIGWGTLPIGAFIGGVLGEIIGLRWVFAFAAMSALSLMVLRRDVERGLDELADNRRSSPGTSPTELVPTGSESVSE